VLSELKDEAAFVRRRGKPHALARDVAESEQLVKGRIILAESQIEKMRRLRMTRVSCFVALARLLLEASAGKGAPCGAPLVMETAHS
jgi:hypothetical protein